MMSFTQFSISALCIILLEFMDGTVITTSPVQKGVKRGDVVRTRGGSLYRLE